MAPRAPASERLPDAEMQSPESVFRLAVHQQAIDPRELLADIEAKRPDRRLVAHAKSGRVFEIARVDAPLLFPDVASVQEEHRAEVAADNRSQLGAERHQRVAANRIPVAERPDLVTAPAADAARPSEEV